VAFVLDHAFVCVAAGGPEGERLVRFGLTEGPPNRHPGQGTANRRFFFRNAMLELLWVEDEAEATSALVARTRLWERWRYRETGASPFGVCLRPAPAAAPALGAPPAPGDRPSPGNRPAPGDPPESQDRPAPGDRPAPPFPGWAYRPPYLPPEVAIDMATTSVDAGEPLLFHVATGRRPDARPSSARPPLVHAAGLREITALRIGWRGDRPPSPAMAAVEAAGIATFVGGGDPWVEVGFDGERQGRVADFRPELPVRFRW
jgi:hypothetical protein